MNKSLFIVLLLLCFCKLNAQSKFSGGFADGYKDGFCMDKGIGCIFPIPPIAPIPQIGENLDNYNDGYKRGFKMGQSAQKKETNNSNNQTKERYKTSDPNFIDFTETNNNNQELMLKLIELKQKKLQEAQYNNLNQVAETKEVIVNPQEFAIINIYRPRKAMGSLLPVEVLVNGQTVAQLSSGGHFEYKIYDLSAKSITIKSAGIATINLMPSKDKVYYFETKPKFSGFTLEQISNPVSKEDLKEKKYIRKSDYTF